MIFTTRGDTEVYHLESFNLAFKPAEILILQIHVRTVDQNEKIHAFILNGCDIRLHLQTNLYHLGFVRRKWRYFYFRRSRLSWPLQSKFDRRYFHLYPSRFLDKNCRHNDLTLTTYVTLWQYDRQNLIKEANELLNGRTNDNIMSRQSLCAPARRLRRRTIRPDTEFAGHMTNWPWRSSIQHLMQHFGVSLKLIRQVIT